MRCDAARGVPAARERWGTVRAWSERLRIPPDVLRERFRGLPSRACVAEDPEQPGHQIVTAAYPETAVLEAVRDLLASRDERVAAPRVSTTREEQMPRVRQERRGRVPDEPPGEV